MNKTFTLLLSVSIAVASCGKSSLDNVPRKDIELTKAQSGYVAKGNSLSIQLFREIAGDGGQSAVISPLSVQMFMGMVNSGSAGKTSDEICSLMGFDDVDQANDYLKYLVGQLKSADRKTSIDLASIFVLNTHFASSGLKGDFRKSLENSYAALVDESDFSKNPVQVPSMVNEWVSSRTNGMIPSIYDDGPINQALPFASANALHFKGEWTSAFDKKDTRPAYFHMSGGSEVAVDMMSGEFAVRYERNSSFSTVHLPFGNGAFEMVVVLPAETDGLKGLVSDLDYDKWQGMVSAGQELKIMVQIPRFTLSHELDLTESLGRLGCSHLFTDADFSKAADFSSDVRGIGEVRQKICLDINESGAEAAAVTYNNGYTSSLPTLFCADHPFLYAIREVSTDTILVIGQYCGD